MITARNIRRRIGGLEDISLEVPAGACTAIIGPNGAGKSTLLDLLAGRSRADSGAVEFGGQPIADWAPLDLARRRAFLPQSLEVAFPIRVMDLVMLGRSPYHGRVSAQEDRAAAETALRLTDAWHLRDRAYQRISGGERQRVQLARVIAQIWRPGSQDGEPRMLLLDEPTASLDPGHRLAVMRLLRDLAIAGIGVVLALHDLNDAARFADQVVLLHQGRILSEGGPADAMQAEVLTSAYGAEAEVIRAGDAAPVIVFR
ncbi:heme ABC transporter ATP-binding protein [Dongia sedimenti]|uniref:Heme ABC transporter ATP-binding protein n=1 Tax=Dongia sedimenti TaxID=3064282 RepID=A0ABU0YGF3_9PROT|nr:heme ABC transporter ATP-binding protein [Rhodospirillaceae bacterium R-7]